MTKARPLIGLTGRRKLASEVVGTPAALGALEADWYFVDYARGILAAGGLPIHLPLDADPLLFVERLDGILLTGGADIDPGLYEADAETDDFPPEPQRDEYELSLLSGAIEAQIPLIGICRGLQLINVHAGGSLNQQVPEHANFDSTPETLAHQVHFAPGSQLHSLYGASIEVNSLHHQTVDEAGEPLRVTARSTDGTVEGFEYEALPIIAVQWHPEMMTSRDADPIFSWLVNAASS